MPVDFRDPGAGEDIAIALAAAFIVAAEQTPAPRHDACIAGAEQRRTAVAHRQLRQLRDDVGAGAVDRRAGRRGMSGPTRDTGIRQIRRTSPELDLIDIEAEPVGRDLSKCGRRALAHVVRADLHNATAITPDNRPGLRLEHDRRKGRGTHAPADQQPSLVVHLPRSHRPPRPAEAFGALRIALTERLRGKWLAGYRFYLGIVLKA